MMSNLSIEESNKLKFLAKLIRKRIVQTSAKAKIPHLGSCLSCIDILIYLYWQEMSISSNHPTDISRDRFVLSKGHAAPALFQVLAEKGFFPVEDLDDFGKNESFFHEHPPRPGYIPGIEAATGSLGHGFPMAAGMAIAAKIKKSDFRCYSVLSDGECNEGSIWEAAMFASANNLDNLVAIIDFNKWQATGRSQEILSLDPLSEKWYSFGWNVYEINGHSFEELKNSLDQAKEFVGKPSVIIAHTIKGKGVSFMEDDNNWHYRTPNNEELKNALKELEGLA